MPTPESAAPTWTAPIIMKYPAPLWPHARLTQQPDGELRFDVASGPEWNEAALEALPANSPYKRVYIVASLEEELYGHMGVGERLAYGSPTDASIIHVQGAGIQTASGIQEEALAAIRSSITPFAEQPPTPPIEWEYYPEEALGLWGTARVTHNAHRHLVETELGTGLVSGPVLDEEFIVAALRAAYAYTLDITR